jgi:transcription antitermination factor NusG
VKRKKVFYPKVRPGAPPPPGAPVVDARAAAAAARTVSIDLEAARAGAGVKQGDRVQIQSGLYAGEMATVESVVGGVIPAAVIRTDAGRTRRVRAIDLTRGASPTPSE